MLAFAREIHQATIRQRADLQESMKAVNQFAATIVDRVHELEDEVAELKASLKTASIRFDDLKRTVDGRGAVADVVDLKPPRRA
jgi:hypothetical protein